MGKNTLELKGFKELRDTLEELGEDYKKAIRKGVRKAAKKIEKESNSEAKRRGWSLSKYYSTKETKTSRRLNSFTSMLVGVIRKKHGLAPTPKGTVVKNKTKFYKEQGDTYYARFPEYGTIKQKAQPLLIPIFESNKENIKNIINNTLKEAIDKAKGKIGK